MKKHHLTLFIIAIVTTTLAVSVGIAWRHHRQQDQTPDTYSLHTSTQASTVTVSLTATGPSPASILVKTGTTVKWVNTDNQEHNLQSDSGIFNNLKLKPNQQYSKVVNDPATYAYSVDGKAGTMIVK